MPSDERIRELTQWLGLFNGMAPLAVEAALQLKNLVGTVRAGQNSEDANHDGTVTPEEHQQAVDEALAELEKFRQAQQSASHQINDWLATHPPTS